LENWYDRGSVRQDCFSRAAKVESRRLEAGRGKQARHEVVPSLGERRDDFDRQELGNARAELEHNEAENAGRSVGVDKAADIAQAVPRDFKVGLPLRPWTAANAADPCTRRAGTMKYESVRTVHQLCIG